MSMNGACNGCVGGLMHGAAREAMDGCYLA